MAIIMVVIIDTEKCEKAENCPNKNMSKS